MGLGGGEGRIPSSMTSAAEREVLFLYFVFFFFELSSKGHLA
jgi:hypothetical protein